MLIHSLIDTAKLTFLAFDVSNISAHFRSMIYRFESMVVCKRGNVQKFLNHVAISPVIVIF